MRIPVTLDSDLDALEASISTSGASSGKDCRLIWIKNTLKLDHLLASEALLEEVEANDTLQIVGDLENLKFDSNNNLQDLL